jgi:lipopolysaccharide/colanic/teichoic acid biosynthesis glycosyltransferase
MNNAPKLSYNQQWRVLTGVLLTLDALFIWSSLTLAYSVRIGSGILEYNGPRDSQSYELLVILSVPIWLILFAVYGLYRRDSLLSGIAEYQQAVKACTSGIIIIVIISFLWRDLVLVSRVWLMLSWFMSCLWVALGRFIIRRLANQMRHRGWFTARAIIVGANEQGISIARQWNNSSVSGMRVVGFADDFKPIGTPVTDGLQVIGRPTRLLQLAQQYRFDEIILLPNAVARETFEEIIAESSGQKSYVLRLSMGFFELLTTGVATTNKTFVPLFTINENRIVGIDAVMKGVMDYGVGSLLLLLVLPLILLIACALKLLRKARQVLYWYPIIGQGGTTFQMVKLNTRVDINGVLPFDATPFERWLYHSGLDKLPQLVNVVAGHMSLVGPRPRIADENDEHLATLRHLQTVKPGIIGPWMVHEFWSTSDEAHDDLYYVRNWTIWLDLQIIVQSIIEMLISGREHQISSHEHTSSQEQKLLVQINQNIAPEIRAHLAKGKE